MRPLILALAMAALTAPALAGAFTVTTPDFVNGDTIAMAQVNTRCGGANRSPALSWSGEPAATQSFAVTMFDPDAPRPGGFWHWSIFDIPASVHALPEGAGSGDALPPGASQGRNGFGDAQYGGPCPPPGAPHHYQITVYAMPLPKLPLAPGQPDALVAAQIRPTALATAQIIGLYGRAR